MRKDDYQRDGFVVVRNCIPPAVLDQLGEDLAKTFHLRAKALGLNLPAVSTHADLTDLLCGLFECDRASYIAAAKLTQHLASVHRFGISPELMDVVEELGLALPAISTRPVIHYMADRLKIPGGYQKTPNHQDWRSVQGSLDALTIWIPLFDVGRGDYPLEIIPRSHTRGILPSVEDVPNYRICDEDLGSGKFEALSMKQGDAVFFSAFLIHRTGIVGGDLVRISFSFRYNNVAEPHFIDRNYPNPYLYRPDMSVLTPDFPGPEQMREIFPDFAEIES